MILIALGANLPSTFGTPEETLEHAKVALEESGVKVLKSSSIWLTAPVPISEQPWYRNAVVAVETSLEPLELIATLQAIEEQFGRVRTIKNAPRVLDLDIIAYNDEVLDDDRCQIPHPRMKDRAFVLYPLQEIVADWVHPVCGASLSQLIQGLPSDQEIERSEYVAA